MQSKIGTICMILGAALILAALSLFLLNEQQSQQAQKRVDDLLQQVVERTAEAAAEADVLPDLYDPTMTEQEIKGYRYIGYLSVPSLGLELPIMSDWSYVQLRIAPCRYSGSTKSDDLVLMAHNYKSHFGNFSKLEIGDAVVFTDMDGAVTQYAVTAKEVLLPTAVEEMTAGEYALTLFTCTYGGRNRVTICCDRIKA